MMLKKIVPVILFFLATSSIAYGQFHEKGYKNLTLFKSYDEIRGIVKTDVKLTPLGIHSKHTGKVKFDGLDLELTFSDLPSGGKELTGIKISSPNAKLAGISQQLIGKDYKTVKSILGNKLSPPEDGNFKSTFLFFSTSGDFDAGVACLLDFDEKGVLSSISVAELGS